MQKKIELLMKELFACDYQFAMATTNGKSVSNRFVDTFYDDGYFYIVTYKTSRKFSDIMANPQVSLTCRMGYGFDAVAECIGHPLDEGNQEIREKLIKVFADWYFLHNNENDDTMCYLRLKPIHGFIQHAGVGYVIDFVQEQVNEFPFDFTVKLTNE